MEQQSKIKQKLYTYLEFLKRQPKGFVYNSQQKQSISPTAKEKQLEQLKTTCKNCNKCPLFEQGRTQVVFGHGNPTARLMLIGEGPGRNEDKEGKPFIGRAGKLLTQILQAIGLKREDVYISNVVKCRPPNNRAPLPLESSTCMKLLLFKEMQIIQPKIICTLGATATCALLGSETRISRARGIFHQLQNTSVMPTYHPAYLLRNPHAKHDVWEDMKKIQTKLKE
ncbi:uracil-DNA glycosylase [Candidatus Babeliales bacterium]|nr:uracil-DNA glycosylase [Candidatus Babeliales bacterium]